MAHWDIEFEELACPRGGLPAGTKPGGAFSCAILTNKTCFFGDFFMEIKSKTWSAHLVQSLPAGSRSQNQTICQFLLITVSTSASGNDGWIRGNHNDSSWMMLNLPCLSVRNAVCNCASNSKVLLVSYLPHLFGPWRVCTRGACLSIEALGMPHALLACLESFLKSVLKGKGPIFNPPYLLHLLLQFHLPPLCSAHMHQMVQDSTCSSFVSDLVSKCKDSELHDRSWFLMVPCRPPCHCSRILMPSDHRQQIEQLDWIAIFLLPPRSSYSLNIGIHGESIDWWSKFMKLAFSLLEPLGEFMVPSCPPPPSFCYIHRITLSKT